MISLCLIGKNETEEFNRLLDNVQPFVDEVVLVANGGDKRFERAMRKRGVRVFREPFPRYHQRYGHFDFSSARNSSFAKARGSVILWLDKDDILDHPERVPGLAQRIISGETDWIHLEYIYARDRWGNVIARHWKPRLIRSGTGKWEKTVHENLEQKTALLHDQDDTVKVLHEWSEEDAKRSAARNLEILLAEYAHDGEKTDPRTLLYLGNTLYGMERYAEAAAFYIQHIRRTGSEEDKYFSLHGAANCLNLIGERERAIKLALEATLIFPDWATAYFDLGKFCLDKLDYRRGIAWLLVGLSKKVPQTLLVLNDLDYTVHPMSLLAQAYLNIGEYKKARAVAESLHRIAPTMPVVKELLSLTEEALKLEDFVASFLLVAETVKEREPAHLEALFNTLPASLADDARIQMKRREVLPPATWPRRSIVFYCGDSLEDWAPPQLEKGIGGSETAVIFMARELQRLGWQVTVYNRCGSLAGTYDGVVYKPYYHFNPQDVFDVLIFWRSPSFALLKARARLRYLWMHDRLEPGDFNDRILNNLDKVMFLSRYHRSVFPNVPENKVFYTRNGIHLPLFQEIDSEKIPRDTKRLLWQSSYDRGIEHYLDVVAELKRSVPDLVPVVCYGWNSFDKIYAGNEERMAWKSVIEQRFRELGVLHLGRVGLKDVLRENARAGIWLYPTGFWEISCIGAMQAQAAGAFPVTTDYAALNETVQRGIKVRGVTEYMKVPEKVKKEMAETVLGIITSPNKNEQEGERREMVSWAREYFSWSKVAEEWDKEFGGFVSR